MTRYFFHLHDDLDTLDDEGSELPDQDAAQARAITCARDVACASIAEGHLNLDHFIQVTGQAGDDVLRVTFGEAITVTGR